MIEIDGISKNFKTLKAVDNVTLSIAAGEVFGLLGPNGAGKTTIIKMATALMRADSGSCRIQGIDVHRNPEGIKKIMGVVPQANNLDRELTAQENLSIYGMLHQVAGLPQKIEEALKAVDLWERRNDIVSGFSGGMQRRLLLARALLPDPAVLFLDEPSIGLDPQIRRQMWDLIRKTRIEGRTVLITTHYIQEAEALCDRVGILMKGRLTALDTPENLKKRAGEFVVETIDETGKLQQRFCSTQEEADRLVRSHPAAPSIRRTNLEDVFVTITDKATE